MSLPDPQRARDRFRAGDFAGAIADARTLAAESDAPAFARALAAATAGDWETGCAAAEAALAQDPGDALALWCRAESRVGLGDREGALADWSQILADDPGSLTTYKDRAVLRALMGDVEGALADFEHLAQLSPADVVPRLWRVGLGAPEAELFPFTEGQGWSARLAQLLLGRASAEQLLGEVDAFPPARQPARRCQVHGYAGLLLERDGDAEGAAAHYRASAATDVWSFLTHLWARERLRDSA